MTKSTHHCFTRQALVDYQLGKLSQDRITQVYAESIACPVCRELLENLDGVSDSMLAALQGLTKDEDISQQGV